MPFTMKWFSSLLLAVAACSGPQQDKSAPDAGRQLVSKIIESDNRADIEGVLMCYSDDAVLMPPGRDIIAGINEIRANYEEIFSKSDLNLDFTIDSLLVAADTATCSG